LARLLVAAHVHPNQISLASLVAAAAAGYCLLRAWYPAAALLILLRLLCNLMDGMVAIEGGLGSASGEIYNDLPDRISDALILCAAGYSLPWPSYARELGWSAALLAVMTAYIRILGGASGLTQDFRGPMAKPQRMAVLVAACMLAPFDIRVLALALMVVVAGSLVTAAVRLHRITRQLEDGRRSPGKPRTSGDR
jgi:phosphatidylglycerophosphate synthase